MNVPKLRFKGFEEKWEEKRLGNYLVEYKERISVPTELPVLTSSRSGLFFQKDYFNDRELQNNGEYGIIPRGYFTYRLMSDDSTFKFNINNLVDIGAISKEYPVFTTNGMNSYFLLQKLNYGYEFKTYAVAQKLGGTRTRLYFNKLIELKIIIPTIHEQTKIANFLTAIDEKITQLTQKYDLLKQYKKGIMQQIFSQKLRFKDEDGREFPKWEEKKLGDIGIFKSGIGFPENMQGGKAGIPFYKVSDMNIEANDTTMKIANHYVTDDQIKIMKSKVIKETAIIFAKVGAAIFLERKRIASNFLIDNNMMAFIPNANIQFIKQYFDTLTLSKFAQVGALPSYNSSDLTIIKVNIPSETEQIKIANFLTAIDGKITHTQTQLDAVKLYKKGLLQQLFV
ncbi:MAG: restriction endonuclease subunit S [Nitrosomonas sp.]|nr:MAG: restriction endonuclease subunit S [Nitrosomonas sp.]